MRIGEASKPGPYSVGGASGSGAAWENIGHSKWARKSKQGEPVRADEELGKGMGGAASGKAQEGPKVEGYAGSGSAKRRRTEAEEECGGTLEPLVGKDSLRVVGKASRKVAGGTPEAVDENVLVVGDNYEYQGLIHAATNEGEGLQARDDVAAQVAAVCCDEGVADPFAQQGGCEGKHIGCRRRRGAGSSTPTDSNATEDIGSCVEGHSIQFATANRSDRGPLEEFMCSTKADVVMAQETHVVGDQVASFRHKLERVGWKVIGAPAVATVGRGSSGGVMVAARSKIGLGHAPGDSSGVVVEGRIAAAHVASGCKGGLVCYTVYLYPSEGLTDRNVKLLESLAMHARGFCFT